MGWITMCGIGSQTHIVWNSCLWLDNPGLDAYCGLNVVMFPRSSYVCMLGPPLVALFGKLMEPLGRGVFLGKDGNWDKGWGSVAQPHFLSRFYSLVANAMCPISCTTLPFPPGQTVSPRTKSHTTHFLKVALSGAVLQQCAEELAMPQLYGFSVVMW